MTDTDKKPGEPHSPSHIGRTHPAAGQESNSKVADDNKATSRQGEQVSALAADQVVTEPSSPPHLGGKMVAAILGPMRGHVLIMPEAEADQAINDHWAVDPHATLDPDHDPHPPLNDAEREAAETAAIAWSETAHNPPPPEPPPDPLPEGEGGAARRETVAGRPGGYQTRSPIGRTPPPPPGRP